jgi:hypothetical protein
MILNSRNNLYNFKLPRNFIPQEVADKYRKYLNRMPGNILTEPIDFINYSIQGINLPGVSFDPVTQNNNDGTVRYHRGAQPLQNLIEREFTVTMQLLDGFINYWIMNDTLLYYYSREERQPFLEDLKLQIMDSEGIHVISAQFHQPILKSISELDLNMSQNVAEFNTFNLTFNYNKYSLVLEID